MQSASQFQLKGMQFITESDPPDVQMTDTISSMTDEYQNYCALSRPAAAFGQRPAGKLTELEVRPEVAASGSDDRPVNQPLGRR